jgi:hypothetical protein
MTGAVAWVWFYQHARNLELAVIWSGHRSSLSESWWQSMNLSESWLCVCWLKCKLCVIVHERAHRRAMWNSWTYTDGETLHMYTSVSKTLDITPVSFLTGPIPAPMTALMINLNIRKIEARMRPTTSNAWCSVNISGQEYPTFRLKMPWSGEKSLYAFSYTVNEGESFRRNGW